MPPTAAIKFHVFKEKSFQGLVYCDYCGKLLWGLGRLGVQCTECGYNCHSSCSDMVIQCRPPRRVSPDSLSVTDSEAESVSKYSLHSYTHRNSMDNRYNTTDDNNSIKMPSVSRSLSSSKIEEPLKSPTIYPQRNNLNKTYRKSLKQQLQKQQKHMSSSDTELLVSPTATAKAFTRLVARSSAFFYLGESIQSIYNWKNKLYSTLVCLLWISTCISLKTLFILPPLCIGLLYYHTGIINSNQNASQVLFPRYDENTQEYYNNLEKMQYAFLFFIRLYDNFVYHLQHLYLNDTTYKILFVVSVFISTVFVFFGRWLVMTIGLMLLLNKTWVGTTTEALLQFLVEVLQTIVDVFQKFRKQDQQKTKERTPMEVSIYENQRWWANTGYTSQLLRSERGAWSNITGLEPLPSKDEMPPPTHYYWAKDDEWHLDTTGPWTDDALEIVMMIECDEQGWVYSDHRWNNPKGNPEASKSGNESTKALTRRRRWYRRAIPISESNKKYM